MSGLNEGMTRDAKRLLKETKGVDLHGGKLRIRFRYKFTNCTEVLGHLPTTTKGIREAIQVREAALHAIKQDTFSYSKFFPGSKAAAKFDQPENEWPTINERLDVHLQRAQKKAPSSQRTMVTRVNKVRAKFGTLNCSDVKKSDIELWQMQLLREHAVSYVRDIFTQLRAVFEDALYDEEIDRNPMDVIKNVEVGRDADNCFPFSRKELERIANSDTYRRQELNMVMFNCWTGLSAAEVIGLAWEDIDFDNWTAEIQRNFVEGEYKVTKEKSRTRRIEIIGPAREWLLAQYEHTSHHQPVDIRVRQRDNVKFFRGKVRIVFKNTNTGEPHQDVDNVRDRFFKPLLRDLGIIDRGFNQCRHTFASQMLSSYVSERWIINQLGHRDTEMLHRHYAKFIPNDQPLMNEVVCQQLGFKCGKSEQKLSKKLSKNRLKPV